MRVDAVRGVSMIRIETVRAARLRHHLHSLTGAGRTQRVCEAVFINTEIILHYQSRFMFAKIYFWIHFIIVFFILISRALTTFSLF